MVKGIGCGVRIASNCDSDSNKPCLCFLNYTMGVETPTSQSNDEDE